MSARILTTSAGRNEAAFSSRDWGLFASISLIWGASFLLIAIGLDAFSPGLITWLRVASGALVLTAFPAARRPIERGDRGRIIALSFTWVAIPFTLFPLAQQWISSAVTGMLNGAMPIFAAIVAAILLKRAPTPAQITGLAIGFGGVIALSMPEFEAGRSETLGVVLVVAATACYGFSVNIAAPVQQRYGSLPVITRMLAWASIWTAPLGLTGLWSSDFAWASLLAVLGAGVVGTGIAFVIMGSLVGSVGSTRASFITYMIPVVALVLGVIFRDEQVAPIAIVGVVLVTAGALLASLDSRR